MKVGSLVYATQQGLGILAKSFYDHGIVTNVMVIQHGTHPEQPWYPGAPRITDIRRQSAEIREFCKSMDVMLFFETPFDWGCIASCKRSVLMTMYECTPANLPAYPDHFLYPSLLDKKVFEERFPVAQGRGTFLTVPVEYPWRLRTKAEVFVHNAGHGGLKGRNGTRELIEALPYIHSGAKIIIRSQSALSWPNRWDGCQAEMVVGDVPYSELFTQGDVFIFPEKFNGLSLPLQEARAAGMLVMCSDRFPMNEWLPREPLIPVAGYTGNRVGPPYMIFQEAIIEPKAIAAKIDEWYGRDITAYSDGGREWAQQNSWEVLKPQYEKLLRSL